MMSGDLGEASSGCVGGGARDGVQKGGRERVELRKKTGNKKEEKIREEKKKGEGRRYEEEGRGKKIRGARKRGNRR
ncbi:hypothetical protein Pcinc_043122 [Petrolisthes cinctipes]|uniref:Uncharacterized protein n=1 Tax=Petrolisthes cinctipes TaxID=88211 RepID=A0AAE1EFD2_PETCI|nr:hypothetical protein Pcinc_043122 [Petrolisthes cinctipes]